jgi:hypothetical protein
VLGARAGNHSNYFAHYVRVSATSDEPCMDFRPPEDWRSAKHDELVMFNPAQILPQIAVYLV